MERLTIRTPKGAALKMNDTYSNESAARKDLMRRYRIAVDRLAAYEDTGLEPEEVEQLKGEVFGLKMDKQELEKYRALGHIDHLRELAQAEKDGWLVVAPCKVGDIVFDIADGTAYATRVLSFSYFGDHWACRTVSSYPDLEQFGTRIFLTREQAEAALKGGIEG